MRFPLSLIALAAFTAATPVADAPKASASSPVADAAKASASSPVADADKAKPSSPVVKTTTCGGKTYEYNSFAGYGFVPFTAKDSAGDTIGGIGSSAAIEKHSWKKSGNKYTGVLWGLPDRGFNVNGTINFQPRVQKFDITFDAGATSGSVNKTNVQLKYKESIFLTDPNGTPMTGLDADFQGAASFKGFPDLPVAHYTGDGFGNPGPGGVRVVLDAEGLVLDKDGSFWISDEYGPYVYHFNAKGRMIEAIRPPNAFLPVRNGTVSFSADSPPIYDPKKDPKPANPTQGRQNNQGFEGLTASPNGKKLYTLIQSALRQDGGQGGSSNRFWSRFLVYDATCSPPKLEAEYVVHLPQASDNATAAQSEIHYISHTQFFVLARDSGRGAGQPVSASLYRHADIFDISGATNIVGKYDSFNASIVTNITTAALKPEIKPATYCSFLDFNVNSELNKFGVHNGGAQDAGLLNEKWESLALVPVGGKDDDEYFLFSLSDNDFRAIDVYVNGGKTVLHDTVNLENQVLVFKITLPKNSKPRIG